MSNLLHRNTNRCQLIKDVSKQFWEDIISFHSTGQNSSEIYYTKKLVSTILGHATSLNYSIFAKEPGMEKRWGSDIDIYIERGVNDFLLYAFQAKLLKTGQEYSDLDRNKNGIYQYQKLVNYGVYKQCYVYYLFYNGVLNYTHSGNNKCNTAFDEDQFGLSYVEIDDIQTVIPHKINWTFNHFHPNLASPLSQLVCCKNSRRNNIKSYDYEEIIKELEDYEIINQENVEAFFGKAIDLNSQQTTDQIDKIESERKSDVVIVIRNTKSTY
ncbi:hypothetical protein C7S20_16775 [Christiangramia fulva]|uniref:Uncharacterized protein n=1 Tax=Christiangramia fulva TaxID=2126553 RepID=A0A2R3Z983_9FLAO|nr:hypothetical protein [Christiangramia fulva]AVR46782.1 hypothetical protein C7S20_16775 [Christiangramia fulva]